MAIFGENNRGRRTAEAAAGGIVVAIGTAALIARLRHNRRGVELQNKDYAQQLALFSDERIDSRVRGMATKVAAYVYIKTVETDNALTRQKIEDYIRLSTGRTPEQNVFNESLNRLTDNGLLVQKGIPEGAGRPDAPKGYAAGSLHFDPDQKDSLEKKLAPAFCDEVLNLLDLENNFAADLEKRLNSPY